MIERAPYRRKVGVVQSAGGAYRRTLHVERTVQLVDNRPSGPYARLELRGQRGGSHGYVTLSASVGSNDLLAALERTVNPGTWMQVVEALGFRRLRLQPIAPDRLEVTLYGPSGGCLGRTVLDRDGRDELRQHVRKALAVYRGL